MKLTTLILLSFFQVNAKVYSQNVSLNEKNAPLALIFQKIELQTGFSFLYNSSWLSQTKSVTIDVREAPLTTALDICFKDQPLIYIIVDKIISIKQKVVKPSLIKVTDTKTESKIDFKGLVLNEKQEPLQGASVEIKGNKKGTYTDPSGIFELKQVEENATLIISFSGYLPKEININGKTFVTVALSQNNNPLDRVQVIAYGTTTQRLNTGDVTAITSKEIEQQPVNNPLLALEGRVPGLFITQASGFAGTGITTRILGQNSIGSGNDPLYIIDGVPYPSQSLPLMNNIQGGWSVTAPSTLNFVNPSDIESISVLKDADATSIYGSRAANGAILITTKKGKAGRTFVDLNLQNGWGQLARKLSLLNTPQYLQMRHEAIATDGQVTGPTDYDINGIWDTTSNTDWQKTLLGNAAQYTNLSGTVSGGTANTQFLVSSTYHRETAVFPGDFADQKGSLHFNIDNMSPNRKFKFQLTGNYMFDDNKLPSHDLTSNAVFLAPDAPSLYNKNGSRNWEPDVNGNSTWINPISYQYIESDIKTNSLTSNAFVGYQIFPGFNISSSFGYTYLQTNETLTVPSVSQPPETRSYFPRLSNYGNNNINSWIMEPQASYKRGIGRSNLELILGETIEQMNSKGQQLNSSGYNSDALLGDIGSAVSISGRTSAASIYKYNAVFSRVSYNYDEKYIINLSWRRDGSSRFGAANQFHNFGSVAGSWIFSKEGLFQKISSAISFGKLSVSYGTTGNDQIGDYLFLSLYSTTYNAPSPYQGVTGLQPNGLTNPYLEWEETHKLRFGLDLGFLNDRIFLAGSYFTHRSSNQLLFYNLPYITGFGNIERNFPATVHNYGWEFSFSSTNIKTKNFTWSTHINFTIPHNKLVAFPNLTNSSYAFNYIIGKPITIQKVFHSLGVNDTTGSYQFADIKGSPTYNPVYGTDNYVVVNTAPTFYGGFENSLSYKGFQLDFLFQFVKQVANNYSLGFIPGYFSATSPFGNQPNTVLERWQKPGDIRRIQRYNSDLSLYGQFSNAQVSDASFSDASYIRLKNLSISWQIPKVVLKKIRLQDLRIFILGQNLFTITKYIGLDPETATSFSLPPLRVLTLGINLTL